ncbi:MAG: ATP synthase F1 subunit gamma [Phycisphaerae bacterium]|nr:ATP synthase F1 subunit gamma [Phycisphaerae bacterium]
MAGTRQILNRLKAAENISKVTHTMETISAVRYKQHFNTWRDGRGFYDSLATMAYLMVTAEKTIDHPLMRDNDSRTNALIVIGSNRGLCGSYNSEIFRLIDIHVNMAKRFNRKLKIYAAGSKVIGHLAGKRIEVEDTYTDFEDIPSVEQVQSMGDGFINDYIAGDIGRLSVVYTRFFSPSSQRAQTLSILPISELIDDLTTRATVIWPWERSFEDFTVTPSVDEFFDGVARLMVNASLSSCFLESLLSEHLERVVAMRSATDNANEMIESLNHEYNRARQGQITNELLDIIGGSIN